MSFEGYYQVLCRNGHAHSAACGYGGYDDPIWTLEAAESIKNANDAICEHEGVMGCGPAEDMVWKCSECQEVAGWWNLVDDTNCDSYGQMELIEVNPEQTQKCNLGHEHVVKQATYRVGKWLDSEHEDCEDHGHYVNGGLK